MCTARDLFKFVLALAVLVLIAAVMALFVSGYLKAYKSGDKGIKVPTNVTTGGRGGLVKPSPSPTPKPPAYRIPAQIRPLAAPEMPPAMGGMPPVEMAAPMPTVTPTPTPAPSPRPVSPTMAAWYAILQSLLDFFPGLFSGPFSAFPQWPLRWI